jgi:hypothetical protein
MKGRKATAVLSSHGGLSFRLGVLRARHMCGKVDVVMEAGLVQCRDYPDHRWLMTGPVCQDGQQ